MTTQRHASKHFSPRDNFLLGALPLENYERLLPHLELVPLPAGKVLSATPLPTAMVQIPGQAYRIPAAILLGEFQRGGALQHLLLRYVQALITQMAQTAVCNRHHRVEQQLCRWLLLSLDLIDGKEVHMTQELISNMLGVQRTAISLAAKKLAAEGLIENHRGWIRVPDRAKIEARTCECYAVVKKEMKRLDLLPEFHAEERPSHSRPPA